MPNKRQAGCRFLLVTSLLDKQKRSNSDAAGARKLLALKLFHDAAQREHRPRAGSYIQSADDGCWIPAHVEAPARNRDYGRSCNGIVAAIGRASGRERVAKYG